jgi:glycosyltransferase involved in cell wall biosynthesis
MNRSDVCVVIPVFNEEAVIGDVVRAVREVYPVVVCVDDGSADRSSDEIEAAGGVLVRHPVNLGQGAALRTGLEFAMLYSDAAYFVTFDADGQHDIADVAQMLALLDGGDVDVVFGSRFLDKRSQISAGKRVVLTLAIKFTRMSTGLALTDTHNGLRTFNRKVAEALDLQMNGMAHASELLGIVAEREFRYAEVPVHIRYTTYSRSKGQPLINGVNILFDLLLK